MHTLSQRELEVATLVAEGYTNKRIARQLDLSQHTVRSHVSHIMSKLNAENRAQAGAIVARGAASSPAGDDVAQSASAASLDQPRSKQQVEARQQADVNPTNVVVRSFD